MLVGSVDSLVSIALCTFNGELFLAEQLESLSKQSYRNLEIIVVDDCSSDATFGIIEEFATRDPRFTVYRNSRNLGFQANFQKAMSLCTGTYIAPCDQDDVWGADKVERLVRAIGGRFLSYCDSVLVDAEGMDLGVRMSSIVKPLSTDDPAPFAFGNCVSGHALLARREVLAYCHDIPGAFFYDWWLAAVAAALGGIVFCPEPLVRYRQHGKNVTDARLAQMQIQAGLRQSNVRESATAVTKIRHHRDTEQRLRALAGLPGPHREFLQELADLWRLRELEWLNVRLWWRMRTHRKRLLQLANLSERKSKRFCRDLLWGLNVERRQAEIR